MRIPPAKIATFQKKILQYYKESGRDLPFRKTTDPYAILLSEIMLQQTQVDRVIGYYSRWLGKWPTVHDLAKADRLEVFKKWLGLGYNNRAKHLHQSAKMISEKFKGDVLLAIKHHKELPGIGPYTAAAVAIFSNNEGIVTVDTNIRRILIHEFGLDEKMKDKELWGLAEKCLPKGKSREWHNALMDYGATLLTSRKSGIRPKSRQSAFEGSDRQIRSKILRSILSEKSVSMEKITMIADCKKERLNAIIRKMENEELLIRKGTKFLLA